MREQLAAAVYGTGVFTAAQADVETVLLHHARAAGEEGQSHPTILDRAPTIAHAHRERVLRADAGVFGAEDF